MEHAPDNVMRDPDEIAAFYDRGSDLVCRGRCIRAGRRVAAAEAEITQGGNVIARAMTSHARLDLA